MRYDHDYRQIDGFMVTETAHDSECVSCEACAAQAISYGKALGSSVASASDGECSARVVRL